MDSLERKMVFLWVPINIVTDEDSFTCVGPYSRA